MPLPIAPMVIASISHGLGNQMFQYAMARALAERLEVPLKLDTSESRRDARRPFELDRLRVPVVEATQEEIRTLRRPASRLRRALERAGFAHSRANPHCFVESKFYRYDSRVLELEAPVYVEGFWQNLRYFEALRPRLAKEFMPRAEIEGQNAALHERIAGAESVCVHVRRGDYLTSDILRVLPIEYYERAVAEIRARVVAPQFVVFSDDPAWTVEHLRLPDPVIRTFEQDRRSAFEDMRLMHACKHFIIANSTFSFWPAWLSDHPGKVVLRPSRWFRNPEWPQPELQEPSWILVDE